MKKSALVLAVLLVLLCGCAALAEEYGEEIRFQGIEWGSTPEEVYEALTEKDYCQWWGGELMDAYEFGELLVRDESGISWYHDGDFYKALKIARYETAESCRIASYQVAGIDGLFSSEEERHLLGFRITLYVDPSYWDESYKDIYTKLSGIYGDNPMPITNEWEREYFCWPGKNQTAVTLEGIGVSNCIGVTYWQIPERSYLEELLNRQKGPFDPNDISGL